MERPIGPGSRRSDYTSAQSPVQARAVSPFSLSGASVFRLVSPCDKAPMKALASLGFSASLLCAALSAQGAPIGDLQNAVPFAHPDGTTHWYLAVSSPTGMTWAQANAAAADLGGALATISSSAENALCFSLVDDPSYWLNGLTTSDGPWIGGHQPVGSSEPSGGWAWAEKEAWGFANWHAGQPDNVPTNADRVCFTAAVGQRAPTWGDATQVSRRNGFVVEFSGAQTPRTVGAIRTSVASEAATGYFLNDTLSNGRIYLFDGRGRVVHQFNSTYGPGTGLDLRPTNGNLIRAGRTGNPGFLRGGSGGIVQEIDWNDQVVWEYTVSSATECQHHDIEIMPNGNILMIIWVKYTAAESIAMGRDPASMPDNEVWPDSVIEVDPTTDQVVWRWNAWDHLIQDFDPTKPNYGSPAAHPERIDINWTLDGDADWLHFNAVDYNPVRDEIIVSNHAFSELWVIDHSTTTAEAATTAGGNRGRGGDLLYRWGNPQTYGRGTAADQQLYRQHDTHWIPQGRPGAGNILIFDNGFGRPTSSFSSAVEIVPPIDANGDYVIGTGPFGPAAPLARIHPTPAESFYSQFTSGAQRLSNGNTLLEGSWAGKLLELDANQNVVWEFENPDATTGPLAQGDVVQPPVNASFRSPWYPATFTGFVGKNLDPIGPLEIYKTQLLAEGSSLPISVGIGDTIDYTLISEGDPGRLYLMATAAVGGRFPLGLRFVRSGLDQLFVETINQTPYSELQNFAGVLNQQGRASASLRIPNNPGYLGTTFHTTFFVLDPFSLEVTTISNTTSVRVE
jgi:hypothetical protein